MFGLKVLCWILTVFATVTDAARILGIVPSTSYSHQVVFQPIWKELSLRGHQVTTITTDPINDTKLVNLKEIDLHFIYDLIEAKYAFKDIASSSVFKFMFAVIGVVKEIGHQLLSEDEVQSLIKNETENFDVVMVEYGWKCALAFAKKFNAPVILMTSMDATSDAQSLMGNPTHPIVFPDSNFHFEDDPSLFNRLFLVVLSVFLTIFDKLVFTPLHQELVDNYFGLDYPSVQELQSDISLLLINSDPIFHRPQPLVPTIVQFGGGSHRTAPKPLPKELKDLLDAAENGSIYFSLGSNVKSKDLSEETRNVIMETFAELPYTVLWKFEADDLKNMPENVFTSKWFPQQDILKHPKIKLFITQGGLQSMDEAIYDHVPMIGLPFFGDQSFNVNKMVHKGFGLSLDYKTLRKDEFMKTILEVINNNKYRSKIKELAELALDQPMTGLEKAVWWTEYVIRHNGTKHLRSPLLDIPFYQYYFLDIAVIVLLVITVLLTTCVFIFKLLCKLVRKRTSKKIKTQ